MKKSVHQHAKLLLLAASIILYMGAHGQEYNDRPVFNTVQSCDSDPAELCSPGLETSNENMHPLPRRVPLVSAQIQTLNFISRPERCFLRSLGESDIENVSLNPINVPGDPESASTGLLQQFREAVVLAYNAWKAIQLVRADVPVLLEGITRAAAKNPTS